MNGKTELDPIGDNAGRQAGFCEIFGAPAPKEVKVDPGRAQAEQRAEAARLSLPGSILAVTDADYDIL